MALGALAYILHTLRRFGYYLIGLCYSAYLVALWVLAWGTLCIPFPGLGTFLACVINHILISCLIPFWVLAYLLPFAVFVLTTGTAGASLGHWLLLLIPPPFWFPYRISTPIHTNTH